MSRVSFAHAFDRWYKLTETERARLDEEKKRSGVTLSWEALDHLCGLAVESGMKALMLKEKLVTPDSSGDFPKDTQGRRPHIDELWEKFIANAQGRKANDWVRRLAGGGKGTPINAFQTWRAEHRYAPDGTISETVVRERLTMAKRLKSIAQEEGL